MCAAVYYGGVIELVEVMLLKVEVVIKVSSNSSSASNIHSNSGSIRRSSHSSGSQRGLVNRIITTTIILGHGQIPFLQPTEFCLQRGNE